MENIFQKTLITLSLSLLLTSAGAQEQQADISIIPIPENLQRTSANFKVTTKTKIIVQQNNAEAFLLQSFSNF